MLPRKSRIPRSLFKPILEKGSYSNSPHFALRAASEGSSPRIAVSVSKKVSKRATDRNKARRRAYSSLRTILPILKPGLYLLSAKLGAEKVKGEKLEEELRNLFSKYLIK